MIVTHNSQEVVQECLEAIAKMAPGLAAVVVDNASSDPTVELARQKTEVQMIANSENRGLAAAANQGFRATNADLILLLNPDVELLTPITRLEEACRRHGLSAGQLTDGDGRPQTGFTIRRFPTPGVLALELMGLNRLWPGNRLNRKYRYLDRNLSLEGPVEQPAGAFLMIRRDVWERLGGFDEAFHPVWFEDVDFCQRATKAGYRIEYVPEVRAEHTGGHAISQLQATRRELYWYGSLLRYAGKHFGPLEYRGVCLAALLSSVPRMVVGMIRERSFQTRR